MVLLAGGCGKDGGDDAHPATGVTTAAAKATATGQPGRAAATTASPASPSPSGTPSSGASASGTGGASTDSTESVEGVWLATADGAKVQLVLGKGKAGLTSTHLCGGSYTGTGIGGSDLRLALTCMDGDKERTKGRGELAPDGGSLVVKWDDGSTDTFSRTGLPSS
ncbi:hypothetical protein [Actinacidiphila yeochonensis]|uniref:hypothetical protein n=1 Tax=Actinacidiphila yeochonensis TaxID=89050 RepID=UPI00068F39E5|nr:hypothetical protein [Actinacidiphila yeochonensis]